VLISFATPASDCEFEIQQLSQGLSNAMVRRFEVVLADFFARCVRLLD
jgi:hypothetical protein